jgi:hypothetical protein
MTPKCALWQFWEMNHLEDQGFTRPKTGNECALKMPKCALIGNVRLSVASHGVELTLYRRRRVRTFRPGLRFLRRTILVRPKTHADEAPETIPV